jgi:hypothetical protein
VFGDMNVLETWEMPYINLEERERERKACTKSNEVSRWFLLEGTHPRGYLKFHKGMNKMCFMEPG